MAKRWTVMVYMAADNSTGPDVLADLTDPATGDLDEMMSVGSNDDLDIVVQIDWKTSREHPNAERLHILPGRSQQLQYRDGTINTGAPAELENFLTWALERFPASNNMLILWGHSFRFAFGYDHDDTLSIRELAGALALPKPLDVLGFDACGMSSIESAYQLRGRARYMVAPEIGMPLPGWPYARILQAMAEEPDISADEPGSAAKALGKAIVNRFVGAYPDKTVSLTMLDLLSANLYGLVPSMRELATSLAIAVGTDRLQREMVLRLFRSARVPTGEPLVDLRELCVNLSISAIDGAVQRAAGAVLPLVAKGAGVVVDHDGHGEGVDGLCGVSAYAPHVGASKDSWLKIYDQLDLSREIYWPRVVEYLASID
jgi:hypothetical protein